MPVEPIPADLVPTDLMPADLMMVDRQMAPRPLGLHLWLAATASASCLTGLTALKNGWPGWNSNDADTLRTALADVDPASFAAVLQRRAAMDYSVFLGGIAAYRAHPYRRNLAPPVAAASFGTACLLDYGCEGEAVAPPVLLIPSLINRGYILDLMEGASLARHLSAAGVRTFLLEWNAPDAEEAGFGLADLFEQRLLPGLDAVNDLAGAPAVVGYCMGGLLALLLAQFAADRVAGLGLLATPWDFHAERAEQAHALTEMTRAWFPALETLGHFPVDALQALFAANDPMVATRKYTAFAGLDPASPEACRFVALEDWLNDGIPLPLPIARETIEGWYGRNAPASGDWRLNGEAIAPRSIAAPALAIIPDQDRIVPLASAMALARELPDAEIRIARAGHIGMMAGRRAARETWRPLLEWLRSLDGA